MMKIQVKGLMVALLAGMPMMLAASDSLPTLRAGGEMYSNVLVTTVTATDIYFSHSKGMGNAKLKSLDPELQKRFKFDAAKANAVEQQQADATAKFHMQVAARQAEVKATVEEPVTEEDGDPVMTKIYARSFRGQRPPQILLPEWVTPPPSQPVGKFVLIVFWTMSCEPCRNLIPQLNDLHAKFSDQLVIIGLSDEPVTEIRKLTLPKVEFQLATDTQARTRNAVEVQGIPHAILIDPKEIVRFEGQPFYLNEERLEYLISKYSK